MKLLLVFALLGVAFAFPRPDAAPEEEAQAEPASLQRQTPAKGPGGKRRVTSFLKPEPEVKAAGKKADTPAEEPKPAEEAKPAEEPKFDEEPIPSASSDVAQAGEVAGEEAEVEPASLVPQKPAPKGKDGKRKVVSFLKPEAA